MTRKPPWHHPQAQKGEHCPCGWSRCAPWLGAASGTLAENSRQAHSPAPSSGTGISSEGQLPLLWCTLMCWDHSAFLLLSLVWCLPSCSLLSEKHLLKDITWAISRETLNTDLTGSSQWRKSLEVKVRGGASQKGKCKLQDKDQNNILFWLERTQWRDFVSAVETLQVPSCFFFSSYWEDRQNEGLPRTGIRKAK